MKIKNKIKSFGYSVLSMGILMTPAVVSAQLSTPGGTGLPQSGLFDIISNLMYWLLAVVGVVGVIGFAIAGLLYLTAAGDQDRIDKAKNAMMYSIIGVIVAIAGLVALQFAKGLLGADKNF